jgi:phosphohistidine phosphatase SixA
MNRKIFTRFLATGLISIAAICYQPQTVKGQTTDINSLTTELKKGGYVIVLRHGATNRDQADTDPLNHSNISKQRLLSAKGKEQAKQVGDSFKKLGIPISKVYTSKFYRAIETGKLVSNIEPTPIIDFTEGGLVVSPIENDRRAQALRQMAAAIPTDNKNTLIVTHKPNIIDAFGKDWFEIKEGEATIFKPNGSNKPTIIGRFQSNDWIAAAKNK